MFLVQLKHLFLPLFLLFNLRFLACSIESARFVFYYGPSHDDQQSYDLDKLSSVLEHPQFVHNLTNFYMHGYNGSQDAFSTRLIVESYLKRNAVNLLTIDWKVLAGGSYVSAQENLLQLTPRIANSLLKIIDAGLEQDFISLVGHSLGGLAVGMIGRETVKQSNGKVLLSRITALDPSNAAAHEVFILPPVQKTDARFVDIIHTDSGKMGSPEQMGHADFWPNGGTAIQPGCPAPGINDKCSHRKAWAYWAQSVENNETEQLWSFHAKNFDDFVENGAECLNYSLVLMGYDCPTSARGKFYLQIDSEYGRAPESQEGLDA